MAATASARGDRAGARREAGAPVDVELRERLKPWARFLFDRWWRVRTQGLAHVPRRGGAILVGNHSGAIPVDAMMVAYALDRDGAGASPNRVARVLYDRFVDAMPGLGELYRRIGAVPARYDVADELLARGELVVIFPEGVGGVAKLFEERYTLQSFSSSAARLAWKHRVPVVPFAIVGAEEAYPLVGRSEGAGEVFGAPYMPITPFFPAMGPLGVLPLPTRWTIAFGPRIALHREARYLGQAADDRAAGGKGHPDYAAMTRRLRTNVDLLLRRALAERDSVFLG